MSKRHGSWWGTCMPELQDHVLGSTGDIMEQENKHDSVAVLYCLGYFLQKWGKACYKPCQGLFMWNKTRAACLGSGMAWPSSPCIDRRKGPLPAPKQRLQHLPAGDPRRQLTPPYSHVNDARFVTHLYPSCFVLANSWQLFAERVDFKAVP